MRIRPISITVHVEAVIDDGENLVPVEISPLRMSPVSFESFDLKTQLEELQAQLDQSK